MWLFCMMVMEIFGIWWCLSFCVKFCVCVGWFMICIGGVSLFNSCVCVGIIVLVVIDWLDGLMFVGW